MDWIISLAHWFGSAVCGQLTEHSYSIAGIELPLCARCTGMYVGALSGFIFLSWRHPRSVALPRSWLVAALPLFFLAWAADGVNSFLASIPILPHLYPPQNLLRLITGTMMGMTIACLIFIMFNSVIWRDANPTPILATPVELLELIGINALVVVAVQSNWAILLGPLTIASLVAILVLNSTLTSALAASFLRPSSVTWREARKPLLIGSAIALILLDGMAAFRLAVGAWAGVPL